MNCRVFISFLAIHSFAYVLYCTTFRLFVKIENCAPKGENECVAGGGATRQYPACQIC